MIRSLRQVAIAATVFAALAVPHVAFATFYAGS
jgi:hypothetical protein